MSLIRKQLQYCSSAVLAFFFSSAVAAAVTPPAANLYQVQKRNYAAEPAPQKFTISSADQAFPEKPAMVSYTQLNPLDPKTIFTIRPYPGTRALPRIGKWMTVMDYDERPSYLFAQSERRRSGKKRALVPAHWISLINARSQYIIEPINYIFIVYQAKAEQAQVLLNAALHQAGFNSSAKHHSTGYYGYIDKRLFSQLATPSGHPLTYSNRDFHLQNDHFRIFGTYPLLLDQQQAFIFIASVSEESGLRSAVTRLSQTQSQSASGLRFAENYGHHFVSFASARNQLAVGLIQAGYATYYSSLGNVVHSATESTEDHDGNVYVTLITP